MLKLLNLLIVRSTQIYDVGYAEGLQFLRMSLGSYGASEREPFAHEESSQGLYRREVPNRPSRLENLYFVNTIFIQPGPLN